MKRILCILFMMAVMVEGPLYALEAPKHSYQPEAGYIPDKITAIKVTKAVLTPIYGEVTVNKEDPFEAELQEGIWYIRAHSIVLMQLLVPIAGEEYRR